MRALAITGMVTACWISSTFVGSAIRATPPAARMSAGHALQRHDRGGAGGLGDPRLLGGDHVHDHAALEHLGEAGLDAESARFLHRAMVLACTASQEGARRSGTEGYQG